MPTQEPQLPDRYFFDPVPHGTTFLSHVINACLGIPGVRMMKNGYTLSAPANCAWLVEQTLRELGTQYKGWSYHLTPIQWPTELRDIKELRKADPRTGIAMEKFVNAYQLRESFRKMRRNPLFRHPTGSGKSLTSLIWSLGQPGQIVIVTGARGRNQWRDQIRRFTTIEPHVVSGTVQQNDFEHLVTSGLEYKEAEKERKTRMDARDPRAIENGARGGVTCACGTVHRAVFVKKKQPDGLYDIILRVSLRPGLHEVTTPGIRGARFDVPDPTIPRNARIVVVSWEVLTFHVEELCALRPVTVVLDEPWRAKSHKKANMVPLSEEDVADEPDAKRLPDGRWVKFVDLENLASSTFKLCKAAKRRALLTATMVKDRIRDAWSQLNYAEPFAWGSYWEWARRYAGAVKTLWGMDDKGHAHLDELMRRMYFIDSYVTREEADINLPPLRIETIYLPPDAQNAPDVLMNEDEAAARAAAVPKSMVEAQLASACSRKRRALCDAVAEAANEGAKVALFVSRHRDVDVLAVLLRDRLAPQVSLWTTDGRTPVDRRHKLVQEYMACPTHGVLLAVGYALGDQVDLHETDIAFIGGLPWTPAELIQWIGRFHRQGGHRACLVNLFVAEGTIDERAVSILLDKLPVLERVGTEGVLGVSQGLRGDEEALIAQLASSIVQAGGDEA